MASIDLVRRCSGLGALAWLLAASAPSVAAEGAPRDVAALMALLRGVGGFEARFVESKELALLSKPLVTEGRMYFRAPDRLARVVEKPRPTRVVVTPDTLLTVTDGREVQRLDIGARAEVRALVSSVLSLLRGDLASLEAAFRVTMTPSEGDRWRLELVPRSERVGALVERLEFEGRGGRLERYVVLEVSGDRATTRVEDVRLDRVFDEEEARRLFEAP